MTYREAFDTMRGIVPSDTSWSLDVVGWHHVYTFPTLDESDRSGETLAWRVSLLPPLTEGCIQFTEPTAELVLAKVRAHYAAEPHAFDAVGVPSVES